MNEIELTVTKREVLGTSEVRKLRQKGFIPAVFNPITTKSIPISVNFKDVVGVLKHGENALIKFKCAELDDLNGKIVLIKSYDRNPVTDFIIHADFYEISLDKEIEVEVPIILEGEAIGTKEGGILQQITRGLKVKCLANKIPSKIAFDVSGLKIGHSIHVSDIAKIDGVTILENEKTTIASLIVATKEEEAPKAAEAVEAAAVEGAEAKKEEGAPQAKEAAAPAKDAKAEKADKKEETKKK
jgi:large subunit ribosomal protein L25